MGNTASTLIQTQMTSGEKESSFLCLNLLPFKVKLCMKCYDEVQIASAVYVSEYFKDVSILFKGADKA